MKHMLLAFPLLVLLGAACGGGTEDPALEPTFTNVQAHILTVSCSLSTSCHKGVSPAGSLNMEAPAYNSLFRAAVADPSRMLVVAGHPEQSFVIDKLRDRMVPAPGTSMPPGVPLEEDRIQLFEAWIAAGAKND